MNSIQTTLNDETYGVGYVILQGRRRVLKSGTAPNAICVPRVPKARAGGEHERGILPPVVRGVRGISPEKFFNLRCL